MNVVMLVVGMFLDLPAAILLLGPTFIAVGTGIALRGDRTIFLFVFRDELMTVSDPSDVVRYWRKYLEAWAGRPRKFSTR